MRPQDEVVDEVASALFIANVRPTMDLDGIRETAAKCFDQATEFAESGVAAGIYLPSRRRTAQAQR